MAFKGEAGSFVRPDGEPQGPEGKTEEETTGGDATAEQTVEGGAEATQTPEASAEATSDKMTEARDAHDGLEVGLDTLNNSFDAIKSVSPYMADRQKYFHDFLSVQGENLTKLTQNSGYGQKVETLLAKSGWAGEALSSNELPKGINKVKIYSELLSEAVRTSDTTKLEGIDHGEVLQRLTSEGMTPEQAKEIEAKLPKDVIAEKVAEMSAAEQLEALGEDADPEVVEAMASQVLQEVMDGGGKKEDISSALSKLKNGSVDFGTMLNLIRLGFKDAVVENISKFNLESEGDLTVVKKLETLRESINAPELIARLVKNEKFKALLDKHADPKTNRLGSFGSGFGTSNSPDNAATPAEKTYAIAAATVRKVLQVAWRVLKSVAVNTIKGLRASAGFAVGLFTK